MDIDDKTISLTEAVRVLKNKGTFTFIDLFSDPRHFKSLDYVIERISIANGKIISIQVLSEIIRLTFPLNTKNVMKYAVLIVGEKE